MKFPARFTQLIALALLSVASTGAYAQNDRVTKLVVPFSPGGGTDLVARALSRHLQKELGEIVVVENKPGAGGNIAFEMVAKANPDGRTLLLATNSLVINPLIYPNVRYDVQKNFAPIAVLARAPVLILGRNNLPFQTLPEMLSYARKNPSKLSYATCGNGSIHHLTGEMLKAAAGIDIMHVPYKGCGPAMVDLAGGQVDLSINSLTSAATYLDANRVKGIAVTSGKPSPLLPKLPTVASAGLPEIAFDGWYAMLAPAGTSPAAVERISSALDKALRDEEVKKVLAISYLEPVGGSANKLASLLSSEVERYRPIVSKANIKGE